MVYIVTFEEVSAAALDLGKRRDFDLQGALKHAHKLLWDGKSGVAIQDGKGNRIFGADLIACCKGEKTLTDDLRAISNYRQEGA